jgi:hypothetical protein
MTHAIQSLNFRLHYVIFVLLSGILWQWRTLHRQVEWSAPSERDRNKGPDRREWLAGKLRDIKSSPIHFPSDSQLRDGSHVAAVKIESVQIEFGTELLLEEFGFCH